ncbi:aspartate dehydrogenase [Maritalea porphyrae]|uniref:aspartate dehydrogenase n=1 Tax=Maritalea porphyrae TaxID=880732 RepID=UPI0022AFBF4E|nr:aspartate dehydrogenase [Maritalea porphyrae]MCZ4271295.1 aspartate dehydrogenase [Maritalea porphyrae]
MSIAILGDGAISAFVRKQLAVHKIEVRTLLVRQGSHVKDGDSCLRVSDVADLPADTKLLVDCAGHEGLREHGVKALASGIDVLTISIGALANKEFEAELMNAAVRGNAKLQLASGAIGALDALRAASTGTLTRVNYIGRKPALGWFGSPAEDKIDLANLAKATVHFAGTAREAALAYPKNANVAASVAISSLGFDKTTVELIADPEINANTHEIEAHGDFGEMRFSISGKCLPDNPRSSALAAMSVVAAILEERRLIKF